MKNLAWIKMKVKVRKEIPWQIHQARMHLTPSIELRKKFLEASYHGQIHAEKVNIQGHLDRMTDPVRKVYLQRRLEWLNKKS